MERRKRFTGDIFNTERFIKDASKHLVENESGLKPILFSEGINQELLISWKRVIDGRFGMIPHDTLDTETIVHRLRRKKVQAAVVPERELSSIVTFNQEKDTLLGWFKRFQSPFDDNPLPLIVLLNHSDPQKLFDHLSVHDPMLALPQSVIEKQSDTFMVAQLLYYAYVFYDASE